MLSNEEILLILADQRHDVPLKIVTEFTDTRDHTILNSRIFKSKLLPVAPGLCFFEEYSDQPGTYGMSSFFKDIDPKYTIVPFGTKVAPAIAAQDFGISYNTFCNELPLQSYTICQDNEYVPKRVGKQSDFFKETMCNAGMWSAGHLIAHRYTPVFTNQRSAATLQLKWNFIPEPHYWNCHQRNHLENQQLGGYYGVYPIYNLRYIHGRTVNKYSAQGKSLGYRPIPDGEFFLGVNASNKRTSIFIPFINKDYVVYDSDTSSKIKNKLPDVVAQHKVNSTACPSNLTLDFRRELSDINDDLRLLRRENARLAMTQHNLFANDYTNSLHHAAVIQQERAATIEINSPHNKMLCAMIFSQLNNRGKTKSYLTATRQHAKILLDKCEAEDSKSKIITDRMLRDFKNDFAEETTTLDILQRLKFTYNH